MLYLRCNRIGRWSRRASVPPAQNEARGEATADAATLAVSSLVATVIILVLSDTITHALLHPLHPAPADRLRVHNCQNI
jgi:hypothetical protein